MGNFQNFNFSLCCLFLGYLLYASKLLGGVLHLVSNCLQKGQVGIEEKNNISQSFIDQSDNEALDVFSFHEVKIKETKTKFFVFVLFIIVSLLDYLFYYIVRAMIEYSEDTNYNVQLETFNIIIIMGFSRIILKYPIYRHSKVALAIIIVHFCGMEKDTKREISLRAATTPENNDTFVKEVNRISLRMNFL